MLFCVYLGHGVLHRVEHVHIFLIKVNVWVKNIALDSSEEPQKTEVMPLPWHPSVVKIRVPPPHRSLGHL